jgi:hypothetical protein
MYQAASTFLALSAFFPGVNHGQAKASPTDGVGKALYEADFDEGKAAP